MSSRSSVGSALALCALLFGLAALWQSQQSKAAREALAELQASLATRDPASSRRGRAPWRESLKKVESTLGSENAAAAFVYAEWVLCPATLEVRPRLPIPEGALIRAAPFKGGPSFDGLEELMLAQLKPDKLELPRSIRERLEFYAPLLRALGSAPQRRLCEWPWPDFEGDAPHAGARRRAIRWLFLLALIEKKQQRAEYLSSFPLLLAASVDLRSRPGLGGFADFLSASALILRALLFALREPQASTELESLQELLSRMPEPCLLECWREEGWRAELSLSQYCASAPGTASDAGLALIFPEADAELRDSSTLLREWQAFRELSRQVEAAISAPAAELAGRWQAITHMASDWIVAPLILQLDLPAARRSFDGWRCLLSFARIALAIRRFEVEAQRLPKSREELAESSDQIWTDPMSPSGEELESAWSESAVTVSSRGASGLKFSLRALKSKDDQD